MAATIRSFPPLISACGTAKLSTLGGYVAATMVAGILAVSSADAAVIPINIGPTGFNIAGPNGNLADGGDTSRGNFPFPGAGAIALYNNASGVASGLALGGVANAAFANGGSAATPLRISAGASIGPGLNFGGPDFNQYFEWFSTVAPAFGPGSFLGFQTATFNYGYLEVTWDGTSQWEILSGAYESVPITPIVTPVPEPSTYAMALAGLACGGYSMWRRRKRA